MAMPVGLKGVRFRLQGRFGLRLGRTIARDHTGNEPVEQPQGRFHVAIVEPALTKLAGEMTRHRGISRIDRNGRGDVVQSQALLHRQDELLEDHARVFAHHGCAQDLARRGRHNLGEAFGASVDPSAVDLGKCDPVDANRPPLLLGSGLGDPHGRDLGIKERGPRDSRVVHLFSDPQDGILKSDGRFKFGEMHVRVPLQHVTDRVDPRRMGLEIVVDLDAMLGIGVEPNGFEVQALDVGQPPRGEQDLRAGGLTRRARGRVLELANLFPVSNFNLGDLDTHFDRKSLSRQELGHQVRRFRIVFG